MSLFEDVEACMGAYARYEQRWNRWPQRYVPRRIRVLIRMLMERTHG